jgi:transcriptional regulator with XRE-family HTH domain
MLLLNIKKDLVMISEEIKKLRKTLGLSQLEFGSELNVSQRAVSAWESNTNDVPISVIYKIYEKWNISPNKILLGSTEFNNLTDQLLKMLKDNNDIEQNLIDYVNKYLHEYRLNQLNQLIRAIKGVSFIEKLSEVWSGEGERMLLVLYYFIEYIEKQHFDTINKSILLILINNFEISKKTRLLHKLVINKEDQNNLIAWIESNFDDLEANLLIKDLPKAKEFVKSELNLFNKKYI